MFNLETYLKVKSAIYNLKHKNNEILIEDVIKLTNLKTEDVTNTFYMLLTLRFFKPKFYPYCKKCKNVLDKDYKKVTPIINKIGKFDYCCCNNSEIEIGVRFFRY